MQPARTIYSIGHSTRSVDEFIDLLAEHAIELLVDVRRFPGSRRHPQFGQTPLATASRARGIEYLHEVDLGGRRRARADSPNSAWQNPQFRGYADHIATPEAEAALERVIARATHQRTALMCAEAHPSRCHRRILADVLSVRGWGVVHIVDRGRAEEHTLDPNARALLGGRVVYPESGGRTLDFER